MSDDAAPVPHPAVEAEAPDALAVVSAFSEAWASGDIDRAMTLVAEEAVYTLHLSETLLAVGGETRGREAIRAALEQLRRDYYYMMYHPFNQVHQGDAVRQQVHFMYRHRGSGEVLRGVFRIHFVVARGRIVQAEEYHDRAMVEAFLRLFGS